MPAPISSRRCAWSNMVTLNPCRAIARAAVSPPIPAPAMMTVREDATAHVSVAEMFLTLGGRPVRQRAFRRASRMGLERGIVSEQRRAIGTDDFARIGHVAEHMRVIERSQFTLAHELARADLDDRDARRVVEMRNDPLCHVLRPPSPVAALLRSSHDVNVTGVDCAPRDRAAP